VDRFTWAIAVGVVLLVAAGIGAAALAQVRTTPPDPTTPGGATLAYVQAIDRGDGEAAWALLAPSAQAQTTREKFLVRVAPLRDRGERERYSIANERQEGPTARLDLVRTYASSGGPFFGGPSTSRSAVSLVRGDDGQWRITLPPDPFVLQP
jgi:hypothetical protein